MRTPENSKKCVDGHSHIRLGMEVSLLRFMQDRWIAKRERFRGKITFIDERIICVWIEKIKHEVRFEIFREERRVNDRDCCLWGECESWYQDITGKPLEGNEQYETPWEQAKREGDAYQRAYHARQPRYICDGDIDVADARRERIDLLRNGYRPRY